MVGEAAAISARLVGGERTMAMRVPALRASVWRESTVSNRRLLDAARLPIFWAASASKSGEVSAGATRSTLSGTGVAVGSGVGVADGREVGVLAGVAVDWVDGNTWQPVRSRIQASKNRSRMLAVFKGDCFSSFISVQFYIRSSVL